VSAVLKLRVPKYAGNFLIIWWRFGFSGRILLYGVTYLLKCIHNYSSKLSRENLWWNFKVLRIIEQCDERWNGYNSTDPYRWVLCNDCLILFARHKRVWLVNKGHRQKGIYKWKDIRRPQVTSTTQSTRTLSRSSVQ
jgi:hypothetical protein